LVACLSGNLTREEGYLVDALAAVEALEAAWNTVKIGEFVEKQSVSIDRRVSVAPMMDGSH
jgi:hypothetical protein